MADGTVPASLGINVITNDAQEFVALDLGSWGELVAAVLRDEGVAPPVEVGLDFVDVERMTNLHEEHLGGTGPTDVLSFPLDDGASPVPGGQVRLLGDVVVCPEIAVRQAEEAGHAVQTEVAVLVVHGVLHLLGYDHADAAQEAEMFSRQAELVRAHGPR